MKMKHQQAFFYRTKGKSVQASVYDPKLVLSDTHITIILSDYSGIYRRAHDAGREQDLSVLFTSLDEN